MFTQNRWPLVMMVVLVISACTEDAPTPTTSKTPEPASSPPAPSTTPPPLSCGDGTTIDLNCPALPDTNATGTITANLLDYDLWAWNSFIALNWPAADPAMAPPQNASAAPQRGLPDTTDRFAAAAYNATTVWETYKEKREIFLFNQVTNMTSSETPLGWNEEPQYGPSDAQVECCSLGACQGGDVFERHLANASGVHSDTLDETIEVASQARETTSALCNGYTDATTPTLEQCEALFPGPTEAQKAVRPPVGPRVFYQGPNDSQPLPLLYEVKLNRGYFDYVVTDNDFYQVTAVRDYISNNGPVTLPARTSGSNMPLKPGTNAGPNPKHIFGPNTGPINYSAATCLSDYQRGEQQCDAGAIQIKAAWINLENATDAEQQNYHTADVLHYKTNESFPGNICKESATYGLAALHIIQRIHQATRKGGNVGSGKDGNQGIPRGGTFVFASWEHIGNDDPTRLTYTNYAAPGGGLLIPPGPYPRLTPTNGGGLPLTRLYDLLPNTKNANTKVHDAIRAANPDSVWLNYRLIGTQYVAAGPPDPLPPQVSSLPEPGAPTPAGFEYPANSGQPYYMANLVVESNVGLQQFQGLPPQPGPEPEKNEIIKVIPHFQHGNKAVGTGGVTSRFMQGKYQRDAKNLAFRTQQGGTSRAFEYNMGGCMGCHGVAQLSGYSFSFVLLENQYGGAPDTVDKFSIAPVVTPP